MSKRRLIDLTPDNYRKLTRLRWLIKKAGKGATRSTLPMLANAAIDKGFAQAKAIFLPEE